MLFSTLSATLLLALSSVATAGNALGQSSHQLGRAHRRSTSSHNAVSHFVHRDNKLTKRMNRKRSCVASNPGNSTSYNVGGTNSTSFNVTSAGGHHSNSTATSTDTWIATSTGTGGSTHTHTSTQTSTGSASTSTSTGSTGGTSGGVAKVTDSKCGYNNPSATVSKSSGPNGEQDWFNCNLNSGWTPPVMKLDQIVSISMEDALGMSDNQFGACSKYLDIFNAASTKYNIPVLMLASFAMQESTCNPNASSGGTVGLFQLASANCPEGGDCMDPTTNTEGACVYIQNQLSSYDGNVIQMIGEYNGWEPKITPAVLDGVDCANQQNFNYIQQFLNGWLQGQNGYALGALNNCQSSSKKRSFIPRGSSSSPATSAPRQRRGLGWSF